MKPVESRISTLLLLLLCLSLPLAAGEIGAPFETSPQELTALAAEYDGDEDVVILLQERTISLDQQGRATSMTRLVYHIRTDAGAEGWDEISSHWSPWYQERPELDARVIEKGGAVHRLDAATISESPARETMSKIFSDSKLLRAPLPALRAGSIVEEVVTVRETRPFFEAGVVTTQLMAHYYPVIRSVLQVDAPENAPVHWATHLVELEPKTERRDGRVTLLWETTDTEPWEELEGNLPPEKSGLPLVAVATGTSWQNVAAAYHQIVEAGASAGRITLTVPKNGGETLDTVKRLVATLHENVRYTGLEFGENSIIPRNLEEVQSKQYGDCKDKATLLVRMLADAGIEARVALLRTGSGLDVFDELPGLGLFDHAIVYVPELDLFIDATAEMTRVGSLPLAVQGRKALIADPETTALVSIPAMVSADNRQIETRRVVVPAFGKGNVVETIRGTGQIEESFRYTVKDVPQDDLEETFGDYASSAYLDDEIDGVDVEGERRAEDDLRITLTMNEAGRAVSDLEEAVVAIMVGDLFDRLSYDLFETETEDERKNDYVFYLPHQIEWNYEIEIPPGFAAAHLPEPVEAGLGEAMYRHSFEERDGKVFGTVSFDSGPARISPASYEEMKAAIEKRLEEPALLLRWEHKAHGHLARGEIREAIEELERLREIDPNDALVPARMALAYLEAGLGQDARDEIDRAIAMDADNYVLHTQKAHILQHDLFGRHFGSGWDRQGAIDAYARAWELDPENEDIAFNAAVLHEYDDRGVRYAPGADLAGAVEWYRKVEDDLFETAGFDANLPLALLYAGHYDELDKLLEKRTTISGRDTYRAVLMMLRKGPASARDAAQLITNRQARAGAMTVAGQILIRLRKYPEASAAYREAAPLSANAAQMTELADMLSRIQIAEDLELDPSDPTTPVRRMMGLLFDLDRDATELTECFSTAIAESMTEKDYEDADQTIESLRRELDEEETPLHFVADLSSSMLQYGSEGTDENGHRIFFLGANGMGEMDDSVFYVVRDGDRYAIAGVSDELSMIAVETLSRLDRGDAAGAGRLLDFVREDVAEVSRKDVLETSVFAKVWQIGAEPEPDRIRLAAAALMVGGEEWVPRRGIDILEALPAEVRQANEPWSTLALAIGYQTEREFAGLRGLSEQLLAEHPSSDTAATLHLAALGGLGDWAAMEAWAAERLAKDASDRMGLRAMARARIEMGQDDEAMKIFDQLVTTGRPSPADYNDAAWFALLGGRDLEIAIQRAQQASNMAEAAGILNTLAAVYAEAGRPVEAKLTVWKAMENESLDEPRDYDWYVLGRIAEHYGLDDAAARSYRKAIDNVQHEDDPSRGSVTTLARERLAKLGV